MSTEIVSAPKNEFLEAFNSIGKGNLSVKTRADGLGTVLEYKRQELQELLPAHVTFQRFKQTLLLCVKNNPTLLDCDAGSILKAGYTIASTGLIPDPQFGEIYMIPFGKTAQVVTGYKGIRKLVGNSGEIDSIRCEAIMENDFFDYDLASGQRPSHKYPLDFGDRGKEIRAFYCIANFRDGGFHFEIMTLKEVEAIRDTSQGWKTALKYKKTATSPWGAHFIEMGKKTVFRRAAKMLPVSLDRQSRNALAVDDAYHTGATYKLDEQGLIDVDSQIWQETSEEGQPEKPKSRLASFSEATKETSNQVEFDPGTLEQTHDVDPDTGEVIPKQ